MNLFLILLFGFIVRMWIIPHTHHVYFDEFEHINIAENMLYSGKFLVALEGGDGFYETYKMELWPPGFHSILAGAFFFFGNSENVAFNVSAFMGTLSILFMFFIVFLLFADENIALCAAFLFSLISTQLKYSGSASPDVASLCFILIAYFTYLIYYHQHSRKSLALAISSLILAVYMRPENGMIIPFFLIILIFADKLRIKTLNTNIQSCKPLSFSVYIGASCIFLIAVMPYFVHMGLGIFALQPIGWNQPFLDHIINFKRNYRDNVIYFFSAAFPISLTILAISGTTNLFKKNLGLFIYFVSWFFVFYVLFSIYHVGNFIYNPDSDRYILLPSISLTVFSALGLYELMTTFHKKKKYLLFLLFSFLLINAYTATSCSLLRTFSRDLYKEYKFILWNSKKIPADIYCISYTPSAIISSIHRNAIAPFVFMDIEKSPDEAVLFIDHWWYIHDFGQKELMMNLKQQYVFEAMSGMEMSDNHIYAFIRLKKK